MNDRLAPADVSMMSGVYRSLVCSSKYFIDFPGVLFVTGKIEVRPVVDPLDLSPAEREFIFDVVRVLGVVGELVGLVPGGTGASPRVMPRRDEPLHPLVLPVLEPLLVGARLDEELHLHLLELPGPEEEILRVDLVPERLADLGDAERGLLPRGGLHVQEVHVDPLGGLGPQVDHRGGVLHRADERLEHQVELPRLGELPFRLAFAALSGPCTPGCRTADPRSGRPGTAPCIPCSRPSGR